MKLPWQQDLTKKEKQQIKVIDKLQGNNPNASLGEMANISGCKTRDQVRQLQDKQWYHKRGW